ncbi:MAG: universal stress protein UspA [Acidocella sp. 20-57-95]|nr:MAG: universal stress protein UspA [Acidocella sp. 20-57-95]OYV59058.1 MAG: universal stress protein UspA [Acidocella sp. 21-58-7]HQT64192.1 universal stress protein [Acidocella sp.]HQU04951.1 universal stress protein [Acidocella sp.]
MSVRKFLVALSSSTSGEVALHTGLMLAKMWNAHLQVLHIKVDSRDVAPLAGEGLSGAMIEEMMTATERESGSRVRNLQELFAAETQAHGVAVGDALRGRNEPSASFASITGREDEIISFQARLADLTIVPHPQHGEDVASADALHAVLFESGRPVMMAPFAKPETIGKRIAIAWNGTHESASALASIMPFVRQAEAVRVLVSDEYQRRGPTGAEVVDYIAHHGVTADLVNFKSIDRVVAAGLLAAAGDFGADLMSMGAYSTSRLRQLILGGNTTHVLEKATLPVLMNR